MDAEKQSRAVRLRLAEDDFYSGLLKNKARRRAKFWEDEIGRLEARLQSLLEEDPAEASSAGVTK